MKKNLITIAGLFFLAVLVGISACKKGDADAQSAEDAARGSYIMADAFAMANDAGNGKSLKGLSQECYTVEIFPDESGFLITFTDGCVGEDLVTRSGSIEVLAQAVDWTTEDGGKITLNFMSYVHDGMGISGSIYAEYGKGLVGFYFTLGANNFKVTYPNGDVAIINSSELNFIGSLISGIELNGSTNGTNRFGTAYTSVSDDLKFLNTSGLCPWPTQGTIKIDIEGEKEIIVDFDQDGTKSCDNIMLVSQKRYNDVEISLD